MGLSQDSKKCHFSQMKLPFCAINMKTLPAVFDRKSSFWNSSFSKSWRNWVPEPKIWLNLKYEKAFFKCDKPDSVSGDINSSKYPGVGGCSWALFKLIFFWGGCSL